MSISLRIGLITTSFPRYAGDAAGGFVFGLARGLARRGHRVEVVVPEPQSQSDWTGAPDWLEGVEVESAPYARPRSLERLFWGDGAPDNLARRPVRWCLAPIALGSLTLKTMQVAGDWDIAISHWLVPSALAAAAVGKLGVRHIAQAHSADINLIGRLPFRRGAGVVVARSADHFGFVSQGLRSEFLSILPTDEARRLDGRASVLPMGIEASELVPSRPREALRKDLKLGGFSVLFLGRLVQIKGVDLLIDAMSGLGESTLVVAGDGSMRAELEARAAARGVDARFMGLVGPRERADLLSACDALVMPSRVLAGGRHEGLPLALVEAMHAGLPVVASSTGSMPELVEDGVSGLLVPPDDSRKLTRALNSLYKNPKLAHRLARDGKERVKGREWPALLDLWEDLILRVKGSRSRPT